MSAKKIKFDKAFVAKTFIDYCHSSAPYFEKRPEILYVIIMTLADVATELGIGEEYLREIRDRYPTLNLSSTNSKPVGNSRRSRLSGQGAPKRPF